MSSPSDVAALLQQNAWIRALARNLVAERELADDLAQDAWVAALSRPPALAQSPRGWLATVLRRRLGELARERGRRRQREELAARAEALPSAHDVVEKATAQRRLVEAVLELDEPYRTTVLLRFFEELPPREIARRAGVPVATVHSRLARALTTLRVRLSRGDGGHGELAVLLPLLREPVLTPVAVLGVSAMKFGAAALVAVSIVLGILLWRSPAESSPRGPSPGDAAHNDVAQLERRDDAQSELPVAPTDERTASAVERANAAIPRSENASVDPPRALRGRVLDAEGFAVAGVELALARRRDGEIVQLDAACTSGVGGVFEIALAPPAELVVSADERYATLLAGSARVQGATEPVVVVGPRIELSGAVVDEFRAPLAGATVDLRVPQNFGADWGVVLDYSVPQRWSTRSGEDGSFALVAVAAVPDASLATALGGYTPRVEPAPGHSDTRLEIVLTRPRADARLVRGVVLAPNGAPVRGARVSARAEVAMTDGAGEFALDVDSHGTRPPLVALKRGFLPATFEPELAANGTPAWPARVELRLGGAPSTIRGRVVDHERRPVAGAYVWIDDPTPFGVVGRDLVAVESQARGDDRFWSYVESDADGAFELAGLLSRGYRVQAIDPDTLVTGEVGPVRGGEAAVELVLRTRDVHERVAGRVVSRRGLPVPDASVHLVCITYEVSLAEGHQNDGIERPAVITDSDGRFELRDVPKSGVGLFVTGDAILFAGARLENERDVENVEIVAALRLHLQVELDEPRDRADRFRVLDASGEPVVLSIMQGVGAFYAPEQPLIDGRSAVVALDDDAATLVLLRDEQEVARLPLSLVPGAPNVVRY